ncbi:tetraacyldisaccharide 4'-kinase [Thermodesulfobacteriota bacterium]
MRRTDWSGIHKNTGFSLYTLPLAVMSFLYGMGVKARMSSLKNRARELPGFVVSIGNITTGGTGKTPAVLMLSRWAREMGYNTVVLSRGYGGSYSNESEVVTDGNDILVSPNISGDEPWMMANTLRGVPVIVSKNRYKGGRRAHQSFGSNFFILDDGFQHISLKRDMDIVLLDAKTPFGNGHLLPWGPLREPLSGLERADAFIFTRSGDNSPVHHESYFSNKPVYRGDHIPGRIIIPISGQEYDPSFIYGKRVTAFSGIAKPESFKESLLNLGVDVVHFTAFDDHYPFSHKDIEKIRKKHEALRGEFLITTEKDWTRIKDIATDIEYIACLTIDFVFKTGEGDFFKMVKAKADEIIGRV